MNANGRNVFQDSKMNDINIIQDDNEIILKGKVLDAEKAFPVAAKLQIKDLSTHEEKAIYYCDEKTGEYLFVLLPGRYVIIVEAQGYYYFSENILIKNIESKEINKTILLEAIDIPAEEENSAEEEAEEIINETIVDEGVDETETNTNIDTVEIDAPEIKSASEKTVEEPESEIIEETTTPLPTSDSETKEDINIDLRNDGQFIGSWITFERDELLITPESINELNKTATYINSDPKALIEVGGYTDSTADIDFDYEISVKRARIVYDKLVELGVDRNKLKIRGYAASNPIASNADEFSKVKNQRVGLRIIAYEKEEPVLEAITEPVLEITTEENDDIPLFDEVEQIMGLKILFKKRKTKIKEHHHAVLDTILDFLTKYGDVKIEITGYTDAKIGIRKAKKVSKKRTLATVEYFNNHGVTKNRMQWRWLGKANPVASNRTKAGKAKNNRVEFEISGFQMKKDIPTEIVDINEAEEPVEAGSAIPKDPDELYFELLEKYGKVKIKDLEYQIQVGAYVNELKDDALLFSIIKNINIKKYPDGIFRYTTGSYKTMFSANEERLEIMYEGVDDAFVISFYEGVRLTIYELATLLEQHGTKK